MLVIFFNLGFTGKYNVCNLAEEKVNTFIIHFLFTEVLQTDFLLKKISNSSHNINN